MSPRPWRQYAYAINAEYALNKNCLLLQQHI